MAQLGKLTVITAFDADDTAYPILGILCDPRAPGYRVPPDLDPHPDTQTWPDHVFHSAVPAQDDQRVMWLYSIFPGPWSTITRQDYDGETLTTKTRRNVAADITTQETLVDGVWTRNFYQQQNDDLIAVETQEYRTVPGNYVPFTKDNLLFGAIAGTRRLVANSSLTTVKTATYSRTYDAHENSDLVVWELIETNSDGTGSPGNPVYPIQIDDFYDNERGAVHQVTQLTADVSSVGTFTVSAGTVTSIKYEAVDQFHRKKITETWAVPAPTRTADEYDIERGAVQTTLQIIEGSAVDGTLSASGGVVTETSYKPLNEVVLEKKVQTFAYPGPELVSAPEIDRDGAVVTVKRQLNLASAITEGETIQGGVTLTVITSKPYSGQSTGPLRWKETRTRALPGTAWTRADVDAETQSPVAIVSQIVVTPSFPIAQTAGSDITYQPLSSVHGILITTTLTGYGALSIVDYPMGNYSAPPLLTDAVVEGVASWDGTPAISINYTKRPALTKEVVFTRTKTYGTVANMQTAQAALTIENLVLSDIIIDPLFLPSIRQIGVLTDEIGPLTYTTGTENPKFPYATESYTIPSSLNVPTGNPSASTYPGRTVVVSATVEQWKYNLSRLVKMQVTTF